MARSRRGKRVGHRAPRWPGLVLMAVGLVLLALGGLMARAEWVVPEVPEPIGIILTRTPRAPGDEPTAVTSTATLAPSAQPTRLASFVPVERRLGAYAQITATVMPTETLPPTWTATSTIAPTETPVPTLTPEPRLAPAQGAPTHLIIPAIRVDTRVVPVSEVVMTRQGRNVREWQVADHAAGWHATSQLPGHGGNVVLAGHNNMRGEVFRNLVKLNVGDQIVLIADGREYVYAVESRFVLPEKDQPPAVVAENARWIEPFPDERLTLVSCWPYSTYTHRVIVVAKPTW